MRHKTDWREFMGEVSDNLCLAGYHADQADNLARWWAEKLKVLLDAQERERNPPPMRAYRDENTSLPTRVYKSKGTKGRFQKQYAP